MRIRFFTQIMDALSAINAVSDEIKQSELEHVQELTYYIVFGAGTSTGAVQAETAHMPAYTGTWAPEGSPVAWVAATRVHKVSISGASYVGRCRISTGIVGGTVSIWALARG